MIKRQNVEGVDYSNLNKNINAFLASDNKRIVGLKKTTMIDE
jgi:hypothetical protein